jgi:hypothetical protein
MLYENYKLEQTLDPIALFSSMCCGIARSVANVRFPRWRISRHRLWETHYQSGCHVREIKTGSFVSLDCGGHADQWRETFLYMEDTLVIAKQVFKNRPVHKLWSDLCVVY